MASGRVLSAVLLLAIATVTVSALIGEHGVPHLLRLRAERQDLGRTAFALLEENARLREDLARLKDDDLSLEELARRQLGLVKPGEIVYRFRSSSRDGRQRRYASALLFAGGVLFVLVGIHQVLELRLVRHLDLHEPALVVGILVDDRRVVVELGVGRDDRAAQRREQLGDGAHGLDLAEGLALLELI